MGEKGQESMDVADAAAPGTASSGTTTTADAASSGTAPADQGQLTGPPLGTDPAWASADLQPGEVQTQPDDAAQPAEASGGAGPARPPLGSDPAWSTTDLKPGDVTAEPEEASPEAAGEAPTTVVAEEGQPQEAAPPEKKPIPEDDELDKELNRAFDRWNAQKSMRPFVSPEERRRKASRGEDDDEWDDDTDDGDMTTVSPPPIPPPTGKDQPSPDDDPFDTDIKEVIT